jgi:tRNA(Leu) C34 or U34 (ribose-2'-O)-methylase TrmL
MAEEEKVEQEEVKEETSAEDVKTEQKEEKKVDNSIPYDRFQQVIEEKNEYKNELEKLKDKLANMDDPEKIKKEYENKLEEISNKTNKQKKEYAVKVKALAEGVKKEAVEDLIKVLDLSKLTIEGEEVNGVDALVADAKENRSWYFPTEEKQESKAGNDFKEGNLDKDDRRNLKKYFGINN